MSRTRAENAELEANRFVMHRVEHPILGPDLPELHLYPLGDLHIGHKGFQRGAFRARRDEILADPLGLVVLAGDIIENATRSSVGDYYEMEIPNPQDQVDEAFSELLPLKDRIVASVRGNHEYRTPKDVGVDPARYIADRLEIPYFGDEAALTFAFGRQFNQKPVVYSVYLTHLSGGGGTDGGKVNALSKAARFIAADVLIGGHTHMPETHRVAILIPDTRNGFISKRYMQLVNCGTFQGRSGFGARKVMSPSVIGSPTIRLNGRKRKVTAEV
jgi:predicted phosphodiesterase